MIAALLCAAAALAAATPLDEGIAAYNGLEFEKATIFFQKVALEPDIAPVERARAFLWLGVSYGQLGDLDGARGAFARAVADDITVAAPADAPPGLVAILDEERRAAVARQKAELDKKKKQQKVEPKRPDVEPPIEAAPPIPLPPPEGGPGIAAVGSGVGAGVFAAGALGVGAFGLQQLSVAYDPSVPARTAIEAYDTAVVAGIVAGALGGVAALAGGVSVTLLMAE